MISGALLLPDREESYAEIIKKRFLRIVIVLMIFTAVLYCFQLRKTPDGFSIGQYLRYFLAEANAIGGTAYWYLYCYLGFLLLLPILRRITKGMTKQDFTLLIIIHFVFNSLLPVINLILSANNVQGISISGNFSGALNPGIAKVMFYPLIGYYLDNNISVEKIRTGNIVNLLILAICGILASNMCTFYEGTHGEMKFTQNYVQLFDYVTTISAFVMIKYFCYKHNSFVSRPCFVTAITSVGSLTFGIYLLDPVLKKILYPQFKSVLSPHMTKMMVSILWCFSSMLVGGLITYIIKKIPGIKKLF